MDDVKNRAKLYKAVVQYINEPTDLHWTVVEEAYIQVEMDRAEANKAEPATTVTDED